MRTLRSFLIPGLAAALAAAHSDAAFAQVDVEPPMPNVMIMLDSSGSMSHKMDGTNPTCPSTGSAALNQVRWFSLVQALTGTVPTAQLSCKEVPRSGASFTSRYGSPSDVGYYLPFFQILSSGCGLIPNPIYLGWNVAAPESARKWYDFPVSPTNGAIIGWNDATSSSCSFAQQSDGILDVYKRTVRFGLMTFDPLVDKSVGVSGADPKNVDLPEGFTGTWSYWYKDPLVSPSSNWYAESGSAQGQPKGCSTGALDMEVGARNPAAPPWEGRLMGFGYEKASGDEVAAQNERIEQVITAMRPYGATPLAGMMSDLRDLVLHEEKMIPGVSGMPNAPLGAKETIGSTGYGDHLWKEGDGCRPFHVIVITDGEPNLDLRPSCEDTSGPNPGQCPFPPIVNSPTTNFSGGTDIRTAVVNDLYNNNNIIFHVVGVALNALTNPAGASCTDAAYRGGTGTRCNAVNRTSEEKTCCLLNSMQYEGNGRTAGNETAVYASDAASVKAALSLVLTRIASGTATRTQPVFQAVSPKFDAGNASAVGHQIRAALETFGSLGSDPFTLAVASGTQKADSLWNGRLERARIACETVAPNPPTPVLQPVSDALGDNFALNVKTNIGSRFMITAVSSSAPADSWRSLRPQLSGDPDQMGNLGVAAMSSTAKLASSWVSDGTVASALRLQTTDCIANMGINEASPFANCAKAVLSWYVGLAPTSDVAAGKGVTRSNPLGGIYHSQPVVVGPPREFVRDEAYDLFATLYAKRPSVIYASSVDGQLHAFKMADNDAADAYESTTAPGKATQKVDRPTDNNELWSFVPPIVLSQVQPNFNRHSLLLDGNIAVRNLPEERVVADAADLAGYLGGSSYRTWLVASSGRPASIKGGGYYFALDVTDPQPSASDFDGSAPTTTIGSPKFLWQLSRSDNGTAIDDAAARLFGDSVPEAAITTISYGPGGSTPKEIPVAILAGGRTGLPATGTTTASNYAGTSTSAANGNYPLHLGSGPVRTDTRDWGTARADRSITIVRLDTGEILFRFIGQTTDMTGGVDPTRVRVGKFAAPMSGTPVAFPGLPGQISTRVFIGDADGVLWALDMSDPDPVSASGGWRLQVAWDPYSAITPTQLTSSDPLVRVDTGPVETPPVVSVDDDSNPVILFATGSQEDFYNNRGKNVVVSLRGIPRADGQSEYLANWSIDLDDTTFGGQPGQRVTGPLNLFDSVAYFATFVPSGDSCAVGASRIWGLKYSSAAPSASPGSPVAAVDFDDADADPSRDGDPTTFDRYIDQTGTIFGVAISQLPSCKVSNETNYNDDNFGSYSSFTSAPPGNFQLVAMTGRPAPSVGDINNTSNVLNGTDLKPFEFTLPTPQPVVKVDSWAAIVE